MIIQRRTVAEAEKLREKIATFMQRRGSPVRVSAVAWEFRLTNQKMHSQLKMMMKEGTVRRSGPGKYEFTAPTLQRHSDADGSKAKDGRAA